MACYDVVGLMWRGLYFLSVVFLASVTNLAYSDVRSGSIGWRVSLVPLGVVLLVFCYRRSAKKTADIPPALMAHRFAKAKDVSTRDSAIVRGTTAPAVRAERSAASPDEPIDH